MNKIKIGKIINTHGIKGELKVAFDDIDLFKKNMTVYIETKTDVLEFILTDFRIHKNHLLIKIGNFNNINEVEKYKACDLYAERDEDVVYYSDLIEYDVYDKENNYYGKVVKIINNNAHDILVIDNNVMIPYVDEFINEIDDSQNKIYINVIEGLFDEV
ncbi:MAG: ribosome maturation factor RimM [Bacilli bacterium]